MYDSTVCIYVHRDMYVVIVVLLCCRMLSRAFEMLGVEPLIRVYTHEPSSFALQQQEVVDVIHTLSQSPGPGGQMPQLVKLFQSMDVPYIVNNDILIRHVMCCKLRIGTHRVVYNVQ